MKRLISTFTTIFAIAMALLLAGCGDEGPRKMGMEKLIAVQPLHGTRIYIIYKDKNGAYYYKSIHHAKKITDGTITIDPHDYLPNYNGKTPYGPLPNCDEDFQKYKAQRQASP